MPIIKWKPFPDVEELFEEFPFSSFRVHTWDLATNVYEGSGNVIVKMHLPGIELDEIALKAEDNYLTIAGSRKEEEKEKDKQYYHKEIKYGSFERVIALPCLVRGDQAEAELKDGVLTVTLPKQEITKKASHIKIRKKD
ncbi:MAG: Hsp20/alpha crystallin family protein [Candidatus Babeliales bacterium]